MLLLIRKKDLKKLKNIDFSNLETELDKNFKFEFSNKEVGDCTHHLTIENDRNLKKSDVYSSEAIRKMSYILTNKDFSKNLVDNDIFLSEEKKKIDFLKEENKDIMEKINKNIEKETFSEAKADIVMMSVFEVGKKQTKNEVSYSHHIGESIETYFNNRIGNLKDKESFVEKNADELGLTLNEDGKIEELYDENSEKYKENIDDYLKAIKENLKEEVIENYEKPDYLKEYSKSKPETLTLQNQFYKNAFPILLSEDDMKLSKSKINNLDGISNSKKEKLKERINDYFNSMSEHSKDIENPYQFKKNCENFSTKYYDTFDKSFDIELPNEKSSKKETSKEKKVEKAIDKEIDF